jgi:hypothetical protein
MRSLGNLDALFEQAEFFIDAVSGYGSDFALFPEFFSALMADYNHLSEAEAIRTRTTYRSRKTTFSRICHFNNINIITGSLL